MNPKLSSESSLFKALGLLSFEIVSSFGFRASNLFVYLGVLCAVCARYRPNRTFGHVV